MKEVFELLSILGIVVVGNILGGVYYSINVKNFKFDLTKFINGILKAICIAFMFVGLAYALDKVPNLQETIGVQPKAMIISAITIYATKIGEHLFNILGISKQTTKKVVNVSTEKLEEKYLDM